MTDGEQINQMEILYAHLAIDAKQWQVLDRVHPGCRDRLSVRRWQILTNSATTFRHRRRYDVTQHLILNVNWCRNGDTGNAFAECLFHRESAAYQEAT